MAQAARLVGDERPEDWLRLIRSRRVGSATFHRLVAEHGSVVAALSALPGIASAAGVEGYEICPVAVIAREIAEGRKVGAVPLLWGQAGYPVALMEVADAPPVLWALGDLGLLARPMPSKHLQGLDSLLAMVQMPGGIPVATFAIGEAGAVNAALFAVAMLALSDAELAKKLADFRTNQSEKVLAKTLPDLP